MGECTSENGGEGNGAENWMYANWTSGGNEESCLGLKVKVMEREEGKCFGRGEST